MYAVRTSKKQPNKQTNAWITSRSREHLLSVPDTTPNLKIIQWSYTISMNHPRFERLIDLGIFAEHILLLKSTNTWSHGWYVQLYLSSSLYTWYHLISLPLSIAPRSIKCMCSVQTMTKKTTSLQLKRASQGILGNFSVVRLWLDKSPAYHDVPTCPRLCAEGWKCSKQFQVWSITCEVRMFLHSPSLCHQ